MCKRSPWKARIYAHKSSFYPEKVNPLAMPTFAPVYCCRNFIYCSYSNRAFCAELKMTEKLSSRTTNSSMARFIYSFNFSR